MNADHECCSSYELHLPQSQDHCIQHQENSSLAEPQKIIRTAKINIMPSPSILTFRRRASFPPLTAIKVVMRYKRSELQGQDTSQLTEKMSQLQYRFEIPPNSIQKPHQTRSHLKYPTILSHTALSVRNDPSCILTQRSITHPHLHNITIVQSLKHYHLRHCTQARYSLTPHHCSASTPEYQRSVRRNVTNTYLNPYHQVVAYFYP